LNKIEISQNTSFNIDQTHLQNNNKFNSNVTTNKTFQNTNIQTGQQGGFNPNSTINSNQNLQSQNLQNLNLQSTNQTKSKINQFPRGGEQQPLFNESQSTNMSYPNQYNPYGFNPQVMQNPKYLIL
jgi:hypothetical protein